MFCIVFVRCSRMNNFEEACSLGWVAHMVKMVTERGHLALYTHKHAYSLIGHARSHYLINLTRGRCVFAVMGVPVCCR